MSDIITEPEDIINFDYIDKSEVIASPDEIVLTNDIWYN